MKNTKRSSAAMTREAAKTLNNPQASAIQKSLAGSVLSQRNGSKQTGSAMEDKASRVMRSSKYAEETKSLAASVLAQSNKAR